MRFSSYGETVAHKYFVLMPEKGAAHVQARHAECYWPLEMKQTKWPSS